MKIFCEESGLDEDADLPSSTNVLEMKWKSVIRLKKQVMSLEDRIQRMEEESASFGSAQIRGETRDGLPKQPDKYTCRGHRDRITDLSYHPVQDVLASCSDDASIKLWDTESGQEEKTLKGHTGKVNRLAFNRAGNLLASCGKDMVVKIWSLDSMKCTSTLKGHEHNVSALCFSPSGDHIISGSWDKSLKVWDITTGYCVATLNGHEDRVVDVSINEKGTMLASCGNKKDILCWATDWKTTTPQVAFEVLHENVIETIEFAPHSAA